MEIATKQDSLNAESITQALLQLNIPVYLSGYRQLCIAISLFADDPGQSMCNELYPAVARALGYIDWRAIEFSIRRAILIGWEHRDVVTWEAYFPGIPKAPSNKQFIATLAQRI